MKLDPKDFEGIDLNELVGGAQKFTKPDPSKYDIALSEAFRMADESLENRERIMREAEERDGEQD